jgi:hypothetical protein
LDRFEQIGFGFKPDAVMLCVFSPYRYFVLSHLSEIMRRCIEAPTEYRGYLSQVYEKAGVRAGMPDIVIQNRLQAQIPEIYEWTLRRFREQCEQRGIRALVVYRPQPAEESERKEYAEFVRITKLAGLDFLDLLPAFAGVEDRGTLILAEWDTHTNAEGHRLLADALYEGLVELFENGRVTPPSVADTVRLDPRLERNHAPNGAPTRHQKVDSR